MLTKCFYFGRFRASDPKNIRKGHLHNPSGFVNNAHRLLKQGGTLAVIGMNPHDGRDRWFLYDYFPGTYETDLSRYPSIDAIGD